MNRSSKSFSGVSARGGRLLVWDVIFPQRVDERDCFRPFPEDCCRKVIETGYGVKWPDKEQGMDQYIALAKKAGFEVITQKEHEGWFFLELMKLKD
jgi:hypothetical protein